MYDTERSQYVALDELAALVREGRTLRVEDAKTGEDLTHATLVQALVEARGLARFLSQGAVVGLLRQSDEELAETLGRSLERALPASVEISAPIVRPITASTREVSAVFGEHVPAHSSAKPAARVSAAGPPAPVWPAPTPIGRAALGGVYAAQPEGASNGRLADEVTSLRTELDALRALLERAVARGK